MRNISMTHQNIYRSRRISEIQGASRYYEV